jgi:hypothetical protein
MGKTVPRVRSIVAIGRILAILPAQNMGNPLGPIVDTLHRRS